MPRRSCGRKVASFKREERSNQHAVVSYVYTIKNSWQLPHTNLRKIDRNRRRGTFRFVVKFKYIWRIDTKPNDLYAAHVKVSLSEYHLSISNTPLRNGRYLIRGWPKLSFVSSGMYASYLNPLCFHFLRVVSEIYGRHVSRQERFLLINRQKKCFPQYNW